MISSVVSSIQRVWWQQVLLIAVLTIVFIRIAGVVGTDVLAPRIGWCAEGIQPANTSVNTTVGRFVRWDSGYYLQIAHNGYRPDGDERAFFPLYPILINVLSKASGLSNMWSGLLISIACFIASGMFLYRWVRIDHNRSIALMSVVWLCVCPMSFFYTSLYTEALFVLLSIAAIFYARRGQFIVSGIAIALAGATRPVAWLLAFPYILEFGIQHNFQWIRWLKFVTGALIAPLGTLGYLLFIGFQEGNLNIWSVYSSILAGQWKRTITWPWITLYDGMRAALLGIGIKPDWFSHVIAWQDLAYALLVIALAIWALFHLRLSLSVFLAASGLYLICNHGPYGYAFWSLPRYFASIIPVPYTLALLTVKLPGRYRWVPIVFSIALLGLLSAWFATGRWVA
jgi:Gpi18-like mannosyltransferase